jgi:hypothetical protein
MIFQSSKTRLVVGTRLHLGNASSPPENTYCREFVTKYEEFALSLNLEQAYLAVDASPKFGNYNLVEEIQSVLSDSSLIRIIPVTPWGSFVPALNAIITQASKDEASHCLFCSAETWASPESIRVLLMNMHSDTLVTGAVLPGHAYQPHSLQKLSGITCPWNTLAIWNTAKLALTGFPLVAEGIHNLSDGSRVSGGVEEVSAISLIQNVLGPDLARAKLIPLSDFSWNQTFSDEDRREWHEQKMKSKLQRPAKHLELLNLEDGVVEHL